MCSSVRNDAPVPPHRVSTSDYTEDARLRLAAAVTRARTTAGWMRRKDAAEHADISLRSIAKLESGEPNVGWRVLEAIGRALPGWTEDTPRLILEGGEPPSISESPSEPAEKEPPPNRLSERERQLLVELDSLEWTPQEIAEALDVLRQSRRGTPTVEQRTETDRAHNETSLGQLGETGTE